MTNVDPDLQDADVAIQAVNGLNEASSRARRSGRPMVLVRQRQLILIDGNHTTLLKQLPSRPKVAIGRRVIKR